MCFLSEAMLSSDHSLLSPLAECAILATISGRVLSHSQASNLQCAYGSSTMDFWLRHEWLDAMVSKSLESLSTKYPVISAVGDPMHFFALMLAQVSIITLCQVVEACGTDSQDELSTVCNSQRRAAQAAQDIAVLSRAHEHIGYFKVCLCPGPSRVLELILRQAHIFLPEAIYLGATCLASQKCRRRSVDDIDPFSTDFCGASDATNDYAADADIAHCISTLRKMQSFNNLAKENLQVLETPKFMVNFTF